MRPIFNPNPFHSSQVQPNGPPSSTSTPQQQVMGTAPGNFCPNPMQIGGILNPQLHHFALNNQFFPFNPMPINYRTNNINFNASQQMGNFNASQQLGQFLPQNSMIPHQLFNQNVNSLNGQWNLHNPMQNLNMNMNANQFSQMGVSLSPQDLAFLASAQLGLSNAIVPNQMPNAAGLQVQGNLQLQQNQNKFNQAQSQGNPGKVINDSQISGNWRKPQNKSNIGRKHDASHNGSMKSHFHHKQNAKGNFGTHKDQRGKGHLDGGPRKSALANCTRQNQEKKRPLLLSYTDQEVKQWREERRKHYPSKANTEKKLTESKESDKAAKLRRQQLKEILAKQAELGCEVAEVPSSYLSDSEKLVPGREEKRPLDKKERFQNKFNKRGKFHQNDRFSKRPRSGNPDSSNVHGRNDQLTKKQILGNNEPARRGAVSKREPTLLQKLLSPDIRRDQQPLLQVFRFMAMNSFFKDWPEKPLKFPTVLVKDSGNEDNTVGEKEVAEGIHKTGFKESVDDDANANYDEAVLANHDQERVGLRKQEPEEEEGEIIN